MKHENYILHQVQHNYITMNIYKTFFTIKNKYRTYIIEILQLTKIRIHSHNFILYIRKHSLSRIPNIYIDSLKPSQTYLAVDESFFHR